MATSRGYTFSFFQISSFAVLLPCSLAAQELERELNLENYLKRYLTHDERIEHKDLTKEISRQNLAIANDLFRSEFTLRGERNYRDTSFPVFPTLDYSENRSSLIGRYSQKTPIGMSIDLEGTHNFGDSNPSLGSIDEEYRVSLSQDLRRNAFGGVDRTRVKESEKRVSASELESKQQLAESCSEGIELYLETFNLQELVKIHKEMEQTSQEALELAQEAFDRRLMRRIDLLAAQSDKLDAESQTLRSQAQLERSITALLNYQNKSEMLEHSSDLTVKPEQIPSLNSPDIFFSQLNVATEFNHENNLKIMAQTKMIEASQHSLAATRNESRSAVNLGIALAQRKGDVNVGATITDYREQTAQVFLQMDWPVFDRTRKGEVQKKLHEMSIAHLERGQLLRQQTQQFNDLERSKQEVQQRLTLARQKVVLIQEQLDEAFNLIESGQIEFEEFARYRNSLLSERNQVIDLQKDIWAHRVELMGLSTDLSDFCGGLL